MKWEDAKKEIKSLSEEEKAYIELLADIVTIRQDKGLTQRELADLTGLKQSAIARFETSYSGTGTANILTVIKVLKALEYEFKITKKEMNNNESK